MYYIELVDGTQYETDKFSLSDAIRVIKDNIVDFKDVEATLTKENLKTIKYLDAEKQLIRTEINKRYDGKLLREPLGDRWVVTYYLNDVDTIAEELEILKQQVAELMKSKEV